jgi:hypothetical protein
MMETNRTLIRTDKNGTRYFRVTGPCTKCHGRGYIDYYKHVEAGVCFECNGTGRYETTEKEYTEEYLQHKAELAERREERRRAAWTVEGALEKMGYGHEIGIVTDADGKLSYGEDFDALKRHAACKYEKGCGSLLCRVDNHLVPMATYKIVPVKWDELLEADYEKCELRWKEKGAREALANHTYSFPPKPKYEGGFVGVEGEKVDLVLKLVKIGGYETFFNGRDAYVAVYTFEDGNHNKLVWKTQKGIDGDVCDLFKVKGTVKEHSEYRGEKQTVLTRCKVETA